MKKFRLFAALIAALLCLQSCGIIVINDIDGKSADETTAEETDLTTDTAEVKEIIIDKQTLAEMKNKAEEALNGLDTEDYAGIRVFIAATDTLFYEGDGSRTPLTSDRVIRVKKISDKLHADVNIISMSEDELYEKLKESVNNREYFADVIAVPSRLVGKLASDGLIKSLRTVPGLDLKADYFDSKAMAAFAGGHALYAAVGEGCFEPEKLYCVYFNKEMAKELGYDFYALVSGGEWTLEKYAECAAAAEAAGYKSVVMNNPGKYKKMLITGSGFDFVSSGVDTPPNANTFGEEYERKVKLIADLPDAARTSNAKEEFLSGKALFYIDTLFAADESDPEETETVNVEEEKKKMMNSELVWGMLPFPKYNKETEYGTYISEDAVVLCVPTYASDDRLSGDLMEAFLASSIDYIKYNYIYHSMLDVVRDNGSVNSLNIIMNNPNYDFVLNMRSGFPTLYANTAGAFEDLLSGKLSFEEYKEREPDVIEYMEKWFPVTNR